MRSNSCREEIAEALERVKGVKNVVVSLIRARAVVVCEPPCGPAELIGAVESAGFGAVVDGA
jgi:copper chaperone CopZ